MHISTLHDAVAQDENGVAIVIYDPEGEPYLAADGSPVTFTVLGLQSKAMRKAADAEMRRAIKNPFADAKPEEARARRVAQAAAGVIGLHGFEGDDGIEVPFTLANVREILSADERVLLQVENGIRQHASFLAASPTS